ncbi:MAG: metallophosphoesterase [Akkermansiaceae bacterium]|nr:metallophosphoesterase [Akkermansiaceae bacterium]
MTHTILHYPTRELLWLSDIHLDRVDDDTKLEFLDQLRGVRYDALLLTGDISNAKQLVGHLTDISFACDDRPVFFLLGNHDYFFGSMPEVERAVADLCQRHENLVPLGRGEVIQLSPNTALVGHRGWYDGRAGFGVKTHVISPDRKWISDFRRLGRRAFFNRLGELGEASVDYFRSVLPKALDQYRNVLVGTHVPPFYQSLKFGGRHCRWERQPYFANCAAGKAIIGIARDYPGRKITVHAGHCHSATEAAISTNLTIRVAGAKPGQPAFHDIVIVD